MSVSRSPSVCLVQPHPLALGAFKKKLCRSCRVVVVSDCPLPTNAIADDSEAVFIFDQATITLPIAVCLENLRKNYRDPKALLLTRASGPDEQFQWLLLGLKGVVLYKDFDDQLRRAVNCVISGGYWVTPDVLAEYVVGRSSKSSSRTRNGLTDREAEVLQLLKYRFSNKEIGLKLARSESTVKFHVANIFSKLGIHDRQSLMDFVESADTPRLSDPAANASPSRVPPLPFRTIRAS